MKKIILSLTLGSLLFGVTPTNMMPADEQMNFHKLERGLTYGTIAAGSTTIITHFLKGYFTHKAQEAAQKVANLEKELSKTTKTEQMQNLLINLIIHWKNRQKQYIRWSKWIKTCRNYAALTTAACFFARSIARWAEPQQDFSSTENHHNADHQDIPQTTPQASSSQETPPTYEESFDDTKTQPLRAQPQQPPQFYTPDGRGGWH